MGWFFNGKCRSDANLEGRLAIVTGSNTGIGKETARQLALRGARVIMACRNVEKAELAAEEIRKDLGDSSGELVVHRLDLSSLSSVRQFCEWFNNNEKSLELLINNAGVMMCPRSLTEDGYELQFATNHLGHFLLTLLLLPTIVKSAPSRIINVASKAHIVCSSMSFDDINLEKSYNSLRSYGRSKLANILFTAELAKRLQGTGVVTASLHPGVVDTELPRNLGQTVFPGAGWLYSKLGWWLMKTPLQGAQTTLHCALHPDIQSGLYYDDCAVAKTTRAARDPEMARQLWETSLQMVHLPPDYDPLSTNTKV